MLSLKANKLATKEAGQALAEMLAANTVLKKLDLSSNHDGYNSHAVEFAQELAVGIRDNGAMTSLNLAENYMGDDGAKHIAAAIKVIHCVLALILTLFSCPSDFVFNCWCLLLSAGHEGTIVPVFVQEWAAYQGGGQSSWRHAQG